MPYDVVRHYINERIGCGFTICVNLIRESHLRFECFLIVNAYPMNRTLQPVYLAKEQQQYLEYYFDPPEDQNLDYDPENESHPWETTNTDHAQPMMTGLIHRHGAVEIRLDTNFVYFRNHAQAEEYGKIYGRLYDLGGELLRDFAGDGG